MKALQGLVAERLAALGYSTRVAAARSAGLVSHNTLHQLASGQHSGRLNAKSVAGLRLALDVEEKVIREAAAADSAPARFAETCRAVARLPPEKVDQVVDLLRALVAEHEAEQAAN